MKGFAEGPVRCERGAEDAMSIVKEMVDMQLYFFEMRMEVGEAGLGQEQVG